MLHRVGKDPEKEAQKSEELQRRNQTKNDKEMIELKLINAQNKAIIYLREG